MSKKDILEKLRDATIDFEDEKVMSLLKQGLKEGLPPSEMINDGLGAGLRVLGDGFAAGDRFMSDLMLAGDLMNRAVALLRPEMEKGAKGTGDVMVIGTVKEDLHDIGRNIIIAAFTGAGYRVVDIGGDCSADQFVKAVKDNKAILVGASAILSPVRPYCKVISDALEKAGLRDKVFYVVGGWEWTQEWSDDMGADAFGEDSIQALRKVKALRSGEMKKLKDRKKK